MVGNPESGFLTTKYHWRPWKT